MFCRHFAADALKDEALEAQHGFQLGSAKLWSFSCDKASWEEGSMGADEMLPFNLDEALAVVVHPPARRSVVGRSYCGLRLPLCPSPC